MVELEEGEIVCSQTGVIKELFADPCVDLKVTCGAISFQIKIIRVKGLQLHI